MINFNTSIHEPKYTSVEAAVIKKAIFLYIHNKKDSICLWLHFLTGTPTQQKHSRYVYNPFLHLEELFC